ncbi:unnamed protein product [Candida verbasci]|uniref:Chitin biosynthesis protein CHS5 n=1 Tax=Candida verbasci TaxID=1227364 RepID=A0A9W4TSX7_9ASCO|nr:unnamed protein product [Candida verbasci]
MVEVSLTVGKLDASLALLLTKDHHLIEFPTILLPNGVKAGSIIKIKCDQDNESEKAEQAKFQQIQQEILDTFTLNQPESPNLKIKNITQTSCVLEWDELKLGTSNLKNLILFKDGKKLGSIPQPLNNRTTKLSGLPVDKSFKFQLRLDTTAGTFMSNEIEVTTHKMTDLSGITICLGDFSPNDQFEIKDIEEALKNMGAKYPPQKQVKVDTTHYLCTRENKNNPEYLKANEMNIPIIRPEWLKACERERRIVGVRDFYIKDAVLPDIFAKNYWNKNNKTKKEENLTKPVINITPSTPNDDGKDKFEKAQDPTAESTPPPIEKDGEVNNEKEPVATNESENKPEETVATNIASEENPDEIEETKREEPKQEEESEHEKEAYNELNEQIKEDLKNDGLQGDLNNETVIKEPEPITNPAEEVSNIPEEVSNIPEEADITKDTVVEESEPQIEEKPEDEEVDQIASQITTPQVDSKPIENEIKQENNVEEDISQPINSETDTTEAKEANDDAFDSITLDSKKEEANEKDNDGEEDEDVSEATPEAESNTTSSTTPKRKSKKKKNNKKK